MHAPEPVEGRREPVLGRGQLRGISDTTRVECIGGLIAHRRRCWPYRQPELMPRAGPGHGAPWPRYSQRNRSACVPRSAVAEDQREAAQVRTDPSCNRTWRRGDAHGRARRREEQDRAARADRQGPVRPAPEEALSVKQVPARSRRCSTRSRPIPVAARWRSVHAGRAVDTWIEYKRLHELGAVRLRPHPVLRVPACTATSGHPAVRRVTAARRRLRGVRRSLRSCRGSSRHRIRSTCDACRCVGRATRRCARSAGSPSARPRRPTVPSRPGSPTSRTASRSRPEGPAPSG